jgi:DNA ligase-1
MLLRKVVDLSLCLRDISSRKEKIGLIADFLRKIPKDFVEDVVNYLTGKLPQGKISVGWAMLKPHLNEVFTGEHITLEEFREFLESLRRISGAGSISKKKQLLRNLFRKLDEDEKKCVIELFMGEVRQGASEGILKESISKAFNVPNELVENAWTVTGDLAKVALTAKISGNNGLKSMVFTLFTPVRPMLAQPVEDLEEIYPELENLAFEYKFDGVRIQIHKGGDEIKIFTRHLKDITHRLPEIVEGIRALKIKEVVIEGEAVSFDEMGKPLPFQMVMRRIGRKRIESLSKIIPIKPFFFDILYIEGESLLEEPYKRRWEILRSVAEDSLTPRKKLKNKEELKIFLEESIQMGHEGLMAKELDSPYRAGTRGKYWRKIKPAESLDLVILAADWGHGRRRGWLSNFHLGTYDPFRKNYVLLGKTFKGLTDREFQWITKKLLEIKVSETPHTVYVKPEIVVEVAFNEIQKSPHYDSGYALRFARIKSIRGDKRPEEADNLFQVIKLYEKQFRYKGKI